MKVKELIRQLQMCDPEATVYVEANNVPNAHYVREYKNPNEKFVYIADTLSYIKTVLVNAEMIPHPIITKTPQEIKEHRKKILKELMD